MIHPTKGIDNHLYRKFGIKYFEGYHRGVDIGCPEGTPVYSSSTGEIVICGQFNGYGSLNPSTMGGAMFIKSVDNNGLIYFFHYGHIVPFVKEGQKINEGDLIAMVADFKNGNDKLPHLHFGKLISNIVPPNNWGYGKDLGNFVDPFK